MNGGSSQSSVAIHFLCGNPGYSDLRTDARSNSREVPSHGHLTLGNHLVTFIRNRMVTDPPGHSQAVFRAIADPTRRRILGLLRGRESTVSELASHFGSSRPAISKHLRLLRSAGLVVSRKQGTARICRLNARPLRAVDHWLRDYESFWRENLRGLKQFVEENK